MITLAFLFLFLYCIRETRQYRRAPTTMNSDGRGVLQRIRINRNVVAVSKIEDTMISLCSTIIPCPYTVFVWRRFNG